MGSIFIQEDFRWFLCGSYRAKIVKSLQEVDGRMNVGKRLLGESLGNYRNLWYYGNIIARLMFPLNIENVQTLSIGWTNKNNIQDIQTE